MKYIYFIILKMLIFERPTLFNLCSYIPFKTRSINTNWILYRSKSHIM